MYNSTCIPNLLHTATHVCGLGKAQPDYNDVNYFLYSLVTKTCRTKSYSYPSSSSVWTFRGVATCPASYQTRRLLPLRSHSRKEGIDTMRQSPSEINSKSFSTEMSEIPPVVKNNHTDGSGRSKFKLLPLFIKSSQAFLLKGALTRYTPWKNWKNLKGRFWNTCTCWTNQNCLCHANICFFCRNRHKKVAQDVYTAVQAY